ncbi:hypothetical protein A9Q84_11125 [Halobacteriovorax marinus]|uniref:DUF374 domain-containing protein n=1 Tax=Halobacteriovorax marinus TaxID=97084 RepID=A0A1Y5FBP3_9BACT|nr:hypothetical protein A9Q84_11125 [Halobacteriovorax marinus]
MISKLIYLLASLFSASYRYRFLGIDNIKKAQELSEHANYLLAVFHQNLLHGILAQRGNPHVVIISKSKDADPVVYTCEKIGTIVVRGSSRNASGVNKGGQLAKNQMIGKLNEGWPGAVTVDGPKGPASKVKAGIIDMSLKSNTTLIPYLAYPQRSWVFSKSWDKFKLPKPFSKIVVAYGDPIDTSSGEEFSVYQQRLEDALLKLEETALEALGNWKALSKKNWHQNK